MLISKVDLGIGKYPDIAAKTQQDNKNNTHLHIQLKQNTQTEHNLTIVTLIHLC